jgi:hypothetical protein
MHGYTELAKLIVAFNNSSAKGQNMVQRITFILPITLAIIMKLSDSLKDWYVATISQIKIVDINVDLWFTDESGIHNCFGAGIYDPCITLVKAYT